MSIVVLVSERVANGFGKRSELRFFATMIKSSEFPEELLAGCSFEQNDLKRYARSCSLTEVLDFETKSRADVFTGEKR